MRLYESLLGGRRTEDQARSSLDDMLGLFTVDNRIPLLNTTMAGQSQETALKNSYDAVRRNGPVFALTMARMQLFSQIRFQWTRFSGGNSGALFGTPELAVLENPWPGGVTADLLARMELDVTTAGNAYIWRRSSTRLGRLRPEWTTIVLGSQTSADHPGEAPDVEVAGYLYDPPKGESRVFGPEQVAHYAPVPDPDATFLGMSWVTPVMLEARADDAAMVHKGAFFRNAATPNLAIKFDPAVSAEAVERFKALVEDSHTGFRNAYKTMYLGGGADPVVVGKDFQQLDFAAVQGKGESRLASAAGMPPSWVGFSEGLQGSALNAGNFDSARRRLADGTMQHLWRNAAASLQNIVRPPATGVRLWFDTSDVPFLSDAAETTAKVQAEQAQTITALVRDGFTPDSAVQAVINQDWTQLVHTGLVSVQMQKPGAGDPQNGA